MSRTYRRKGRIDPNDKYWALVEWEYGSHSYFLQKIFIDPKSKNGKKKLAKFYSDAGTHQFKEPGPGWFRNLFCERKQRRMTKQEIKKWMKDSNYEPIVYEMLPLPYWT